MMLEFSWAALGLLAATLVSTLFYLGNRIDGLAARMDARFDRVDARFDHVDSRFDHVESRIDALYALLADPRGRDAG